MSLGASAYKVGGARQCSSTMNVVSMATLWVVSARYCHTELFSWILSEDTFKELQASSFVYVVVNFLFQVIFIFPLFFGMVMYANEFKTKGKQKLPEIKN